MSNRHETSAPPPAEATEARLATLSTPPIVTPTPSASVPADSGQNVTADSDGKRPGRGAFRLGNRPPLTGIRALCMIPVVVYHSNFHTLPGAWMPLQIFFVLSGFLITSMLAAEGNRHGRISIWAFYSRRFLRLVPPLLLTVALMGIYAAFVNVSDASQRVWGDALSAITFSDYRQALGHAPFFGFLAQTWSLSVEEQFYVLWAVFMVIAVAAHRHRLAYGFAITGILASLGDRLYYTFSAPHFSHAVFTRVYYAFDTRADGILVGCLLGLLATDGYFTGWKTRSKQALTVSALVCTGFLIWVLLYSPLWQESMIVFWLPLSTISAAVILVFFVICPDSIGSRFVGIAPFVFLGEISYAIYLLHFPIFLVLQPGPHGTHWSFWPTELLRLGILLGLATASWFLIEKPLMRWRQRSAAKALGPTKAEP